MLLATTEGEKKGKVATDGNDKQAIKCYYCFILNYLYMYINNSYNVDLRDTLADCCIPQLLGNLQQYNLIGIKYILVSYLNTIPYSVFHKSISERKKKQCGSGEKE